MNNKSMTESELKEFLTNLKDSCGNKEKEQWYLGLIDDLEIAFTEEVRGNELHPDTENLLKVCFEELRLKLIKNQKKYGWSNEWLIREWEQECREEMINHIKKGDPRDVAIYAMFMIYRGWPTISEVSKEPINEDELKAKFIEVINEEYGNLVLTPLMNKCVKIAKQYTNSKLQTIDEILLSKAKDLRISVDFSDKEYNGDKEAPMDRIGFLEYIINFSF